ncbi:hypothetical protein LOTGIDRAFT_166000 [Lottia gigantea]|uniref:Fibrinogen C-terminal domain-containing protein n=1 Tax=Lottia gigantea TaxID=225164 RepID=V3ZZA2_LOTGI|nr:hypothetical protein LOTGIDRAFT_166000 [Lottia gigantea]ESO87980.1 hypothetical protein LOTGIDRAFT_166000 [Lottia gigantea]
MLEHEYRVCTGHYARLYVRESRFEKRDIFCYFYCGQFDWCRVVTIQTVVSGVTCLYHENLFEVDCHTFPVDAQGGYKLIYKKEEYTPPIDNGCKNGGTRLNTGCVCVDNYVTPDCSRLAHDCSEFADSSAPYGFTIHMVRPYGYNKSIEVSCTIRFAMTLILLRDERKFHGTFNRSWSEYKYTFGDSGNSVKSYWMGLEKLYILTNQPGVNFRLQVFCYRFSPIKYFNTYYNNFVIGNASTSYAMTTGLLTPGGLSGVDGMGANRSNVPFCTYDRPCSGHPNGLNGGWWYVNGLEKYALTNPFGSLHYLFSNSDLVIDVVSVALDRIQP